MRSLGGRRWLNERSMRIAVTAAAGIACLGSTADPIARADSAWARRAEGESNGRPQIGPILDAVALYDKALASHPGSLEAHWKLLRALHFAGDFAAPDDETARRAFERAREVSGQGLERLAERVGTERLEELDPETVALRLETANVSLRDAGRLYFWSAINWGAWSRTVGLVSAVRQGVANRMHRYTRVSIALDPDYEEGGAYRLLGRLHAELPRVPFVTGWVDRQQALPWIERAHALAPANPGNRLLLALTLLDLAPERRGEALALLDQLRRLTPRPGMRIEDLAMRREAGERLAAARSESS